MSIDIRLFTFFVYSRDGHVLGHSSQSPKPAVHRILKRSEIAYCPLKFKKIGYSFDNLVRYSFDVSCLRPSALYNTTVVPRLLLTNYDQLLPWQSDPKT